MKKKNRIVLLLALAVALAGCGSEKNKDEPVIYEKGNVLDVESFKAEIAEEQKAAEEEEAQKEAQLHANWIPTGGYSCLTTNTTFYIRVESVNLDAGTAEIYYQISKNGEEDREGIRQTTGTITKTDYGDGNLEYNIKVNDDMSLILKGYIRDRESILLYKGSRLGLENHGNGK